jgi:hypothetical protein
MTIKRILANLEVTLKVLENGNVVVTKIELIK